MSTFGPYTPVRQAGSLYYVSGQVGIDMTAKTAPTDVAAQARQALYNLQALLAPYGLTMDEVVKTTVFLADIDDFTAVNEVYETFFEPPRPARSAIAVQALPKVAGDTLLLVEIEAVAYRKPQ